MIFHIFVYGMFYFLPPRVREGMIDQNQMNLLGPISSLRFVDMGSTYSGMTGLNGYRMRFNGPGLAPLGLLHLVGPVSPVTHNREECAHRAHLIGPKNFIKSIGSNEPPY